MASMLERLLAPDRIADLCAAAGWPNARQWRFDRLPGTLTNMTTEDLLRVRLDTADGVHSVIVKVARHPRHSPMWDVIPPEFHDDVQRNLPWRAEADIYRSSMRSELPGGMRMPHLYAVDNLGDDRLAMWMEDVPAQDRPWDDADFTTAGRALGRLAGRFRNGTVDTGVVVEPRDLRGYFFNRVVQGVLPGLREDATWAHPLIADVVDPLLRRDTERLVELAPGLLDRLDALPRTLAHGDACPQNILRPRHGGDLVVIDWSFVGMTSVGFDIGQLLAGLCESGDMDPSALVELLSQVTAAYGEGLADEGAAISTGDVELGVAAALVLRSAFSALPLELLDAGETEQQRLLFERRAGFARFLVDLGLELAISS